MKISQGLQQFGAEDYNGRGLKYNIRSYTMFGRRVATLAGSSVARSASRLTAIPQAFKQPVRFACFGDSYYNPLAPLHEAQEKNAKNEKKLCDILSDLSDIDLSKLSPEKRVRMQKYLDEHKQHRKEDHQSIVNKLTSDLKEQTRRMENHAEAKEKLAAQIAANTQKLEALKKVDPESSEFLDNRSNAKFTPSR